MNTSRSESLFDRAKQLFPGGVNSPVRSFSAVDGRPLFIERALGAYLWDVDGNSYIDYVNSWGPAICGHANPAVRAKLIETSARGFSFGACHELEIELAEKIMTLMPSIQQIRFVSSGTEACMSAVRLARAFTGRPKLLKFAGNYHGHYDSFLVQAGSGALTLGLPDSPGVLPELTAYTLIAEYNDLDSVAKLFEANAGTIAAVMLEPVVGNAGCLLPKPGFLEGLRSLCDAHGALLVFDEVMTGFRVAQGGAQERFGIMPDITTLGKIIGGGLPVGAYGGRADIMNMVAPAGPMYQAGTLSGNPLGMAAGLATLDLLSSPGVYNHLEEMSELLCMGLYESAKTHGIDVQINRCGAMFTVFFGVAQHVADFATAKLANLRLFATFFKHALRGGVYLPPSQFEAAFFSNQHDRVIIEKTLSALDDAMKATAISLHSRAV